MTIMLHLPNISKKSKEGRLDGTTKDSQDSAKSTEDELRS